MSLDTINFKVGDQLPSYYYKFTRNGGKPSGSLSGATVYLEVYNEETGGLKFTKTVTETLAADQGVITDADNFEVRFDWGIDDWDTAGDYIGYFYYIDSSGKPESAEDGWEQRFNVTARPAA